MFLVHRRIEVQAKEGPIHLQLFGLNQKRYAGSQRINGELPEHG